MRAHTLGRIGLFSEPSYLPPNVADYRQLAENYIAEVAPTFTPQLRERLANEVTAQMFGEVDRPSEVSFHDPLLELNRAWEWPELVAVAPYAAECPHPYSWNVWSHEQWNARLEANHLREFVAGWTLGDWLYNTPMTQVRQWRDTFLPTRAKRGPKVILLIDLKQEPNFRAEAQRLFKTWQDEQASEVERLMGIARQKPIARHLAWLAKLTQYRLDAHHSLTNSCEGPQAYAEFVVSWVEACREGSKGDLTGIDEEVAEATAFGSFVYGPDVMAVAKEIARSYIELTKRNAASPMNVKHGLESHQPIRLVPTRRCRVCEDLPTRRRTKLTKTSRPALAPFHLLCTCETLRWRSDFYQGNETTWAIEMRNKRDMVLWAMARHLGINYPLDVAGLLGRASSEAFERQWQAKQAAVAESASSKGASAKRNARSGE